MGTKFRGLMTLDMFVDTWIQGFQIICNIIKVKKYLVVILNSLIALPTNTRNYMPNEYERFHSIL